MSYCIVWNRMKYHIVPVILYFISHDTVFIDNVLKTILPWYILYSALGVTSLDTQKLTILRYNALHKLQRVYPVCIRVGCWSRVRRAGPAAWWTVSRRVSSCACRRPRWWWWGRAKYHRTHLPLPWQPATHPHHSAPAAAVRPASDTSDDPAWIPDCRLSPAFIQSVSWELERSYTCKYSEQLHMCALEISAIVTTGNTVAIT